MSGIAGVFRRDGGPVDSCALAAMTRRLAHRGSGAESIWSDGPVGLGRTVRQSMRTLQGEGNPVVAADIRLDNRAELIAALGIGAQAELLPDSDILLAAYNRWGEACTDKLLGDFAFAIWDERNQRLFCARDPFGVKPFYYHSSSRLFAFGSEIKALLELPEVSRQLDDLRIAGYLTGMIDDTEATFYSAIRRLPPAHWMMVTREKTTMQCYWTPDAESELRLESDGEYAEAFRERFFEAVRCRLGEDSSTGALLSGGLDSSSIVSVARQIATARGNTSLHTFSAIFPGSPECDEQGYINAVLDGGNLQPHFLDASTTSPMTDIDELLRHHDEPFFSPNLFVHAGLFARARAAGIEVMLDGFDGDTVVSHGTGFLSELARAGRWREFMAEVNGLSSNFNIPKRRVLWRRGIKELMPPVMLQPAFAWRRRQELSRIGAILNTEFSVRSRYVEHASDLLADRSRRSQSARHDHARRLMSGVIPFTLEVLDRTASLHSVEPRYPFFDRRLVEFCLSLPGEQKVRHGWTRSIMRRALAGILPDRIAQRGGKALPGASFARNLLTFEHARLENIFQDGMNNLHPYVDIINTKEVVRRYRENCSIRDAISVWRAATLSIWLNINPMDENSD
jgi:asparagine synthase (glutamine-hydrolysing)